MDETLEIQELRRRLEELEIKQEGGAAAMDHELIERELRSLDDPYSKQNPNEILGEIPPDEESPSGYVVTWLNPVVREQLGMNGWQYLKWGDKYVGKDGENLKNLIPDLPAFAQGQDRQDSLVRRGDRVLGRLPKDWWDKRQKRRELESARRLSALDDETRARLQSKHRAVQATGAGLQRDETPHIRKAPDVSQELQPTKPDGTPQPVEQHAFSLTTPEAEVTRQKAERAKKKK